MYVDPWCLSSPSRSHHCIKDVLEEQDEWVRRMKMIGSWYVFILLSDNDQNFIDLSDKTHITLQDCIYLSERLAIICEPSEMLAARRGLSTPPLSSPGCRDFTRNSRRSVILCTVTLWHQGDLVLVKKKTPSNQMALPRPLWSPVSWNKDAQLELLPSVSNIPWASICLTSWGNRIVSYMPPGTVLYFEWVPDVLRDARWLTRGRPAFRKMCPISLDMNHEFKLAGPAVGGEVQGPLCLPVLRYHAVC